MAERGQLVMPHIPLGSDLEATARGKVADNLDHIAAWIDDLVSDHAHMSCEHIDIELLAGKEEIRRFAAQVRPGATPKQEDR